jgi:DNA-binding response OmpR family regulator
MNLGILVIGALHHLRWWENDRAALPPFARQGTICDDMLPARRRADTNGCKRALERSAGHAYHFGVQQGPTILVVDDDTELLALVSGVLERSGMRTLTAQSVAEAEDPIAEGRADLVVLDLMMPGEDGLSFCRRLRASSTIPVIMLTAMAEDIDRIVGLEIGADDYLGKPFNPRELVARIKAVLRRRETGAAPAMAASPRTLRFDGFALLPDQLCLKDARGSEVALTSGEFALLLALVERAPRVLSREMLLDLSRGVNTNPFDRSIDSQISRIRRKIEPDPRQPRFIKTVRNLGYAFSAPVTREGL